MDPISPGSGLPPDANTLDGLFAIAQQEAAEKEIVAAVEQRFNDWRELRMPF